MFFFRKKPRESGPECDDVGVKEKDMYTFVYTATRTPQMSNQRP